MLIYVHGFASSGSATKAGMLKKYLINEEKVLAPDLPVEPYKAMILLQDLIKESKEAVHIVGSSLGGFYAMICNCIFNIPAVLINPTVHPWISLQTEVGMHKNHHSDETFEWKKEYLYQLEDIYMKCAKRIHESKIFLLLAEDDPVLDYRVARDEIQKPGSLVVWDHAGHEFSRFDEALPLIREFFILDKSLSYHSERAVV